MRRLLGLIFFLIVHNIPAHAEVTCRTDFLPVPRDVAVTLMDLRYAEKLKVLMLASDGNLLEIYATEDNRAWTLVLTTPAGLSCPVADGEALGLLSPVPSIGG